MHPGRQDGLTARGFESQASHRCNKLKGRNMEEKVIVAVKLGLDLYAKVRKTSLALVPVPEKGKSYFCCHLTTSPVVDFEPYRDGYKVKTINSTYLFYTDTIENVEAFARENGLPGKQEHSSGSIYWGIDSRW